MLHPFPLAPCLSASPRSVREQLSHAGDSEDGGQRDILWPSTLKLTLGPLPTHPLPPPLLIRDCPLRSASRGALPPTHLCSGHCSCSRGEERECQGPPAGTPGSPQLWTFSSPEALHKGSCTCSRSGSVTAAPLGLLTHLTAS